MSNSEIEQSGTVKGRLPNGANLSGRISNGLSLSGRISIGGAGDFIIKMTVTSDGNGNYTVTSCSTTIEQIDAAVAAEKRVVVFASLYGTILELPMLQGAQGEMYSFGMFLNGQMITSFVKKIGGNTSEWQFLVTQIEAVSVSYSNDALPNVNNVGGALNALVPKSHTHSNKAVLDKFAESDGKPTYNGEALGSGTGDFIIKMTIESHDDGYYTVASCDATIEQIDAAVAEEKRVVLIATDTTSGGFWEMPIVQAFHGETYIFMAYTFSGYVMSTVYKYGENETWEFVESGISAESVDYYNSTQPDVETVMAALNKLFTNSHTHANKAVLDKFAETDGKPTYNGEALGGGAGDFIIKMTVESNGSELIVTSCDTTVEQIDAAVAAEKRVVLIASIDSTILELPMIQGDQGYSYYFGAFLSESVLISSVYKTENTSSWAFAMIQILAGAVSYSNDALPNVTDVESALNELVSNSHTHSNKGILDKLSVLNGKLQYNGSDVGLKPVKGTDYWTAADKTEIVNDTLAALPTWTGGSY